MDWPGKVPEVRENPGNDKTATGGEFGAGNEEGGMMDTPTREHASAVYRSLMDVWTKGGEMKEAEFINAVAVNLGKFIGFMKHDPADYLPTVLAAAAAERENSPMSETSP